MQSLKLSHITSRGSRFYLLLAVLFLVLLKIINRQIKMNTINEVYKFIYAWLIENGFNYTLAKYIMAQTAHETGNFTSDIFKHNHNLFGMKLARVRQTTAIGERKGHALYENIEKSLEDFKLYFEARKYLPLYSSIENYIQALKDKQYFEADIDEYIKGVKFFHNLYFKKDERIQTT